LEGIPDQSVSYQNPNLGNFVYEVMRERAESKRQIVESVDKGRRRRRFSSRLRQLLVLALVYYFFCPIINIRKGNKSIIQAKGIARGLAIRKRLADTKGLPKEWQTGNWIYVQCKAVKESIFTVWLPAYSPPQSRDYP
jgi:hypothetical protein